MILSIRYSESMSQTHNLSSELKGRAQTRERCELTITLLELCGMVVSTFVIQLVLNDRPSTKGKSLMMRGDNVSTV